MTDTPRSERSQTRFSTPVSDLDDHRRQPEYLPRADETRPATRRGTIASIVEGGLDLAQLDVAIENQGMASRDFEREHEQAVVDDDKSIRSGHEINPARRGSISPVVARRNTFRRQHRGIGEKLSRSRESSGSRSSSSPNSVDAFAETRRRNRAGTLASLTPSVENLTLKHTASIATHRRRPTFDDERPADGRNETASLRSLVEDDVCFPPDEKPSKTYTIDFEDLEEFVASAHEKTPASHPFTRRSGPDVGANEKGNKIFHDRRYGTGMKESSNAHLDAHNLCIVPEEKHTCDEKHSEVNADDAPLERQHSETEPMNRWTFFSSELDESIHAPELGGLLMPGETFRDLFELGPSDGVWWLDMLNPTEEEVFAICKGFSVHPLTREDITTQETREKVELFKSYYFLCFRSFCQLDKESEDYMEPINIYAVVFREGLLTFSFCENSHASNVRKRLGRLRDYVNLTSDWICYALIDDIVDLFGPTLRAIEQETDAIEDNVFTARSEDSRAFLRQVGQCRKTVNSLLRLLGGKADVIKGFAKRCNEAFSVAPRGDVGLYLSDVQDHVVTMMSNLSHFEKMLSRSHSNYLAQISLDSMEQGNRANLVLGRVTFAASILVPLNLICGLFGMNVPVPGRETTGLGWFFGIVGVILGFCTVSLVVARRLRFI
ncbi:hypothetical protein LTR66_005855 [Elasticomyces elasticus]|nr:hypothetical protein LTR66_005855 [Elasticomyces elasticus]